MPKQVLIPFRHPNKVKAYEAAARAAGMEPVPVFVGDPIPFANAAGLLLMGGTDVNPKRYGAEMQPGNRSAGRRARPSRIGPDTCGARTRSSILAICRGLQILNVYHGGTLTQHLGAFARSGEGRPFGLGARSAIFARQPVGADRRRRSAGRSIPGIIRRSRGWGTVCTSRPGIPKTASSKARAARQTFRCRGAVASGRSNRETPRAIEVISELRGSDQRSSRLLACDIWSPWRTHFACRVETRLDARLSS